MNLRDCVGDLWAICFQDTAETILGRTADDMAKLKEEVFVILSNVMVQNRTFVQKFVIHCYHKFILLI